MVKSAWVNEVRDLNPECDGVMRLELLIDGGELLVLRGKGSTCAEGLGLVSRRYQEIVRVRRRLAEVVPYPGHKH